MKYLKESLFIWIFICCLILAHATDIKHKVIFDTKVVIDTTVAADGNTYSVIKFTDCSFSSEEGNPQLPVRMVNLIIPANEEPVNVICSQGGGKAIPLKYPILPVQKPIPTSVNFVGNEFVFPNKRIYSRDNQFPGERARVIRTNCIRGNKVVVIEVSPVAYNPAKNQLEVFESLEINLQLKTSDNKLKAATVKNKEKFDSYLKALVDNANDVNTFSAIREKSYIPDSTKLKSAMITTGIPVYCEYVVITPSSLASYFDDFITWKKQKGVDIKLVTTEQISQNYTGDNISGINDDAGKIRQFLSEAYTNGLEYALLAGDYSNVPIRYGWGDTYNTDPVYQIPTDLYFSDFDGDWNVDADNRYGEPTQDNVNYGSEIFVGRLLCTNGSQILNWVQKLLQYEKNPGNGSTSYLRKAFYTQADDLQEWDQARDIANRFGSIFTTDTIYEEIYNGVPNYNSPASPQFPLGAQVITEMNTGYGFISWFNHGQPRGIAVGTKWFNNCSTDGKKIVSNYDSNPGTACPYYSETGNGLDNLAVTNKPYVLYTLACETTPFDTWLGIAPTDNLGAMTTIQSGKGGPIYLGNTRYGYVEPSWYMQQVFTANIIGGTFRLGAAEANSKGSSGGHFVWLSHNLIGCPETEMWTSTPSSFNGSISENGTNVTVNTGGAVADKICIVSALNDGYFQEISNVSANTFLNVSKPYYATITKHNYIPYQNILTNVYVQNKNLSSKAKLNCQTISAGYNVDPTQTLGNVVIQNGANITFDATGDIILAGGFEVQLGATFEAK